MEQIFKDAKKLLDNGISFELISIIQAKGSVPRGMGAHMIVTQDAQVFGTVGGGRVEYEAEQLGKFLCEKKENEVKLFRLGPSNDADLGMICGGNVDVLFQYIDPSDVWMTEVISYLAGSYHKNKNLYLVREYRDKKVNAFVYDEKEGYLNHKEPNYEVTFDASMQYTKSEDNIRVVEQTHLAGICYVFGGGHISHALVPVLQTIGFTCVVLEDREELLSKERFGNDVELVHTSFANLDASRISEHDYVVVASRGHQLDFDATKAILKQKPKYIGMLGSKAKVLIVKKKLLEEGYTKEEIEFIHAPIGISIGAGTPEEIAVSIAAEMIAVRSGMEGK